MLLFLLMLDYRVKCYCRMLEDDIVEDAEFPSEHYKEKISLFSRSVSGEMDI